MKESDNWNQEGGFPPPPSPDAANAGGAAQQRHWPPGYGAPGPFPERLPETRRKKKKWVAGLLAFFVPGIGHMYLGLMVKGIVLMMLLFLDITALIQAAEGSNTLPVVLLSFLIPIIYFYSLFDAIQRTDTVNERTAAGAPPYGYRADWGPSQAPAPGPYPQQHGNWEQASPEAASVPPQSPQGPQAQQTQQARNLPPVGILVVAGAGVLMLVTSGTGWTNRLFSSAGSVFGAVVLIGAGIVFWFWENRAQKSNRN